jgi:hypothetical protein
MALVLALPEVAVADWRLVLIGLGALCYCFLVAYFTGQSYQVRRATVVLFYLDVATDHVARSLLAQTYPDFEFEHSSCVIPGSNTVYFWRKGFCRRLLEKSAYDPLPIATHN